MSAWNRVNRQAGLAVPISFAGILLSLLAILLPSVPCGDTASTWLFLAAWVALPVFYSSFLVSAASLVVDRFPAAVGLALGVNLVLGIGGWLVSVVASGGVAPVAARAAVWIPFWLFGVLLEAGRLQDVCPD